MKNYLLDRLGAVLVTVPTVCVVMWFVSGREGKPIAECLGHIACVLAVCALVYANLSRIQHPDHGTKS